MEQSMSCEEEHHHVAAPPQKSSRLMRMLHRYAALRENDRKPAPHNEEEGGACHFGRQEYWENRYSNSSNSAKANNEWYFDYSKLRPYLSPHLLRRLESGKTSEESNTHNGVLILGCGESRLAEDMLQDGCSNILSVDYSTTAIENMRDRSCRLYGGVLKYEVADVRCMECLSSRGGAFSTIIDKGTMDTLLNTGAEAGRNVGLMLNEVYRLLVQGGVYILVTFGAESERVPLITDTREEGEGRHWTVETIHTLDKGMQSYYIYVVRKNA